LCVIPFVGITVKIESDDKDCDDGNGILTNEEAVHDQELEGKNEVVPHDQELEGKCDVDVPDQELERKYDIDVPDQELEGIYDIYGVREQDLMMTFNGNFVLLIDTQSVVSGVNNKI
jgi:hypothetical protein